MALRRPAARRRFGGKPRQPTPARFSHNPAPPRSNVSCAPNVAMRGPWGLSRDPTGCLPIRGLSPASCRLCLSAVAATHRGLSKRLPTCAGLSSPRWGKPNKAIARDFLGGLSIRRLTEVLGDRRSRGPGSAPGLPAPPDTQTRIPRVKRCRWDQCSPTSDLWQADSGQTLGDRTWRPPLLRDPNGAGHIDVPKRSLAPMEASQDRVR